MNIAHLTWTLAIGGAEEMLVDIVNQQCRTERVGIIVVNDLVSQQVLARVDSRVKLYFVRRKPGSRAIKPLLHLNWLICQIHPDIIHVHSWSLVKLLLFYREKLVLTVHTTREAPDFDSSISRYDAIFAISGAVLAEVQQKMDQIRPPQQIRPQLVTNGIESGDIRVRRRQPRRQFRIVQVARLEHCHKGQDTLLRALSRVRDEIGDDRIALDFIGSGSSRPMLEDMVRELRLERSVRFQGAVPRAIVYENLCTYDLLVQASRYEGFGLTVVEAMVAGVPVLASDLEGLSGIIKEGRFGFLFRPDDFLDCAVAMRRIREMTVDGSPVLTERVQAAREYALREFDVNRTASEYLSGYRDVLRGEDRAGSHTVSEALDVGENQVTSRAARQ